MVQLEQFAELSISIFPAASQLFYFNRGLQNKALKSYFETEGIEFRRSSANILPNDLLICFTFNF